MNDKRSVEHYRDHEIVCAVTSGDGGWRYLVSVLSHHGDDSTVSEASSDATFASDLAALQAGRERGRELVDGLVDAEQGSG